MTTWLVAIVCVLANLAAITALVLGRKSPTPKSYAIVAIVATAITPVFGIVGTVVGLQHAFDATATADASRKATLLATGISEAMNATAFGLVACIVPFAVSVALLLRRTPKPNAT